MRKALLIIVVGLLYGQSIDAQRRLEVVTQPFNDNVSSIATAGDVILAGNGDQYLVKYNDISASRYNFPILAGGRLRFIYLFPMATRGTSTYLVLHGGSTSFLFAFNGGSFSRISIPGSVVSGAVNFRGSIYVLSRSGSLVRLYRYNGSSVTEVPFAFLGPGDSSAWYELHVRNDQLYLLASNTVGPLTRVVKRYDGTSTFTFRDFDFPAVPGGISDIIPVGSTGNVYFQTLDMIVYFNGSAMVPVFTGNRIRGVNWRDRLYFLSPPPFGEATRLRRADGATVSEIPLPVGMEPYFESNLVVYRDALFMLAKDASGFPHLLSYDGSSFSDILTFSPPYPTSGKLLLRDANLIIDPPTTFHGVYEYDGSTFTTIEPPDGHNILNYLDQTDCNHLWTTRYVDPSVGPTLTGIYKESKSCPTPATPPVIVIPRRFFEFERFDGVWSVIPDRECWSDIILNWVIEPICPVPEICPRPIFAMTLSDAQNNIGWQQKFEKPAIVTVPLDGKTPFKTTLSFSGQNVEDLILMDQDVVDKGITGIGLSFNYKEENFFLAARTREGAKVPLLVTLLNKDGKEIWRKELNAPFFTNIKDKVAEPGITLRFSVPSSQPLLTAEKQEIEFNHRNPSHGTLLLDIEPREDILQGELIVSNTVGQLISKQALTSLRNVKVNLPEYRPGIFVITIKTKTGSVTNKMVWLR